MSKLSSRSFPQKPPTDQHLNKCSLLFFLFAQHKNHKDVPDSFLSLTAHIQSISSVGGLPALLDPDHHHQSKPPSSLLWTSSGDF